jgi:C-terminal processing protease CtpA/Prc
MDTPTEAEALEFYNSIHLGDIEAAMTEQGWELKKLNKFGSLAKAGALVGDIVAVIGGKPIANDFALNMMVMMEAGIGATVKFGIIRKDKKLVLNVKLKKRRTLSFDIDEADVDLRKIAPA